MTPERQQKLDAILSREMDPDLTFMQQFEEWAADKELDPDGVVLEWLASDLYRNPTIMSELDNTTLTLSKAIPSTGLSAASLRAALQPASVSGRT